MIFHNQLFTRWIAIKNQTCWTKMIMHAIFGNQNIFTVIKRPVLNLFFRYFLIWCEKFVPEKLILTEQLQAKKKKVREKKLSVSSCKQNKIFYFALVEKRRFFVGKVKKTVLDSFLSLLSLSLHQKIFPEKKFRFGGYWLKPKSLLFYFFHFRLKENAVWDCYLSLSGTQSEYFRNPRRESHLKQKLPSCFN